MNRSWYALYTRPRFEKKVEFSLLDAGHEAWLPIQKVVRQWSDRKKKVEVPLFNGYVFVRTHVSSLYEIVQTHGVARSVGFNGKPAPIVDHQIEMVRKILIGPDAFEVKETGFREGDAVRIIDGPLKGNPGIWVNWRGKKRVCLKIDHLSHVILVEVPAAYVEKV